MALEPEKVQHYRNELAATGEVPAPAPVVYVHGTADRTYRPTFLAEETALDETLPFFTVTEMLQRNGVPPTGPAYQLSSFPAAPASPRWCCRSSSARRPSCRAR